MSATTVSPAPFDEAKIDHLIEQMREHSDEKLLEMLVMSIEHMQHLALEAGWGGIYNTGAIARVAYCELALRGVTLSEEMLADVIARIEADDA